MLLASVWVWQLMQPTLLASACSWDCPDNGEPPWAKVGGAAGRESAKGTVAAATKASEKNRRLKITWVPSSVGELHVQEHVVELLRVGAALGCAAGRGVDVL